MKFYPKNAEAAARLADHMAAYADLNYACNRCDDTNTVELPELTPSGNHHMFRCSNGHVTDGRPSLPLLGAPVTQIFTPNAIARLKTLDLSNTQRAAVETAVVNKKRGGNYDVTASHADLEAMMQALRTASAAYQAAGGAPRWEQ
jgi:hypothetical protein